MASSIIIMGTSVSIFCALCGLKSFFDVQSVQYQFQVLHASLFVVKDGDRQPLQGHALAFFLSCICSEQKHIFATWLLNRDYDDYFHDPFRYYDLLPLMDALSYVEDQVDSL